MKTLIKVISISITILANACGQNVAGQAAGLGSDTATLTSTATSSGTGSATSSATSTSTASTTATDSATTAEAPVAAGKAPLKGAAAAAQTTTPLVSKMDGATSAVVADSAPVVSAAVAASMTAATTQTASSGVAFKLTMTSGCVDPDLSKVQAGVTLTLCNGSTGTGTYTPPPQPDLTNLRASNILVGVTINGVTGSVIASGSLPTCTQDGQRYCVAQGSFPAVDMTQVQPTVVLSGVHVGGITGTLALPSPGVIKAGINVLGVIGEYPSVTYPLPLSSGAALTTSTMNTRLADPNTIFEWYAADGTRYTSAGDANLVAGKIGTGATIFGVAGTLASSAVAAGDVRYGTVINGVTGSLKVQCRNSNDTSVITGALNVPDTVLTSNATLAAGSTQANSCGTDIWTDLSTGSTCAAGDGSNCLIKDKITGLTWSRVYANATWVNAKNACASLTFSGLTGWRLPSQKEVMEAYVHGMNSMLSTSASYFGSYNAAVWTSTSANTTQHFFSSPGSGYTSLNNDTASMIYMCVR